MLKTFHNKMIKPYGYVEKKKKHDRALHNKIQQIPSNCSCDIKEYCMCQKEKYWVTDTSLIDYYQNNGMDFKILNKCNFVIYDIYFFYLLFIVRV